MPLHELLVANVEVHVDVDVDLDSAMFMSNEFKADVDVEATT